MSPEERFTRIENSIQAVVETQARHELQLEKQNAGIRDLIVVSRTIINNVNELTGIVNHLAGDVKQLIITVDRLGNTVDQLSRDVSTLVKSLQKPNGNQ